MNSSLDLIYTLIKWILWCILAPGEIVEKHCNYQYKRIIFTNTKSNWSWHFVCADHRCICRVWGGLCFGFGCVTLLWFLSVSFNQTACLFSSQTARSKRAFPGTLTGKKHSPSWARPSTTQVFPSFPCWECVRGLSSVAFSTSFPSPARSVAELSLNLLSSFQSSFLLFLRMLVVVL